MITIQLSVNGKKHKVKTHSMKRLLDVLREELELTGTKEGCGEGECGACSVMMNGRLVNSCLVPVAQAAGARVKTIEGVAAKGKLTRLQKAFIECGGAQCGICTPGMILASEALLTKKRKPEPDEIREALAGNLCRCTGYRKIVDSVKKASTR